MTVVSSGARQRLVVGGLLSASGNDKGHLAPALQEARRVLHQAGLPLAARLQVAGDAGYWSEEGLRFAALNRAWVDVLLKESSPTGPLAHEPGMLKREAFELQPSKRAVVCPAGRAMRGPVRNAFDSCEVYFGVGCAHCPPRARCTRGTCRKLSVRWEYECFGRAMLQRMSQRGAAAGFLASASCSRPLSPFMLSSQPSSLIFRADLQSDRFPKAMPGTCLRSALLARLARVETQDG
ncbi:hypothetical protein OV207_12465 [Corallococcus sp. BB11-1]|uniref:hypothetical protein n=1 Tax=Corallococcus sp. BB11-1 TaxID=2996783 RepID=UPI002272178C|nr:hypothetical protein [Corallococcus sp. BB11-1]MCY1032275.1 hypothetical protein [Corallococcus sp. BB11-1]